MDFFTHLKVNKSSFKITHADQIILFGSCFAESVGNLLASRKFKVDINPFGILYNPESIRLVIHSLLCYKDKIKEDLFYHNGLYHSFFHHSSFSAIDAATCLKNINNRGKTAADNMEKANRLLITFGTASVFYHKKTGEVVSNCHKLPAVQFSCRRLTVTEIVTKWEQLLSIIFEKKNELQLIFTVSPIRYMKDGFHENQLSKATLLLAIDELVKLFPAQVSYFPAYEMMTDDLRDYRFYAEDMCHPSKIAIQYIWENFIQMYMDNQTLQYVKEIENILKSLNHKPFNPTSEAYKQFVTQTLLKIKQLSEKRPYICFKNEIDILKKHL